ncbi:mannose-1-phosphate guanylyltransferase/mannose-6-phosphate isomerase [Eilatimonas milleporae]|uniref:mannose-1-phosphate guanylyltransferase n=1 Tax=Eilatimonas milleporae TaxID=911205 RepID=A0A3M0CXT4_9PROT|nr:mannose-1-phosphate guanylyltransferase/mannose-6-phosphate isomerase [Eilatimonas milleporae]RMB12416.1 mannose-1-phosphate guanylyltransferase/mannose-1-phosphate guanylyltransferase/mannose-6-phosphate isomerase [Eilatimonas milleporae]
MFDHITPVILSGGSGTRLWPLSRSKLPKQFLKLFGDKSLFQSTVERVAPRYGFRPPLVISNTDHRFLVNEALAQAGVGAEGILLEPFGRNTAPAAALAALMVAENNPGALLLIMPSDHVILDMAGFHKAVETAASAAAQGYLCCFGMTPDAPETGYGYIAGGDPLDGATGAYVIESFREKPDVQTARRYLEDGKYSWNSGMFLFRADTLLQAMEEYQKPMLDALRAVMGALTNDLDFLRLDPDLFAAVPSDSIDYAIMEKTGRAAIVPAEFGWSDLGSFSSLWAVEDKDEHGNVTVGDVMMEDCRDCLVHGGDRLVTALGIQDLIIVATDDAILVSDKNRDQDVKRIVSRIKAAEREEADLHTTVYRPWGSYRSITVGGRYQVKEITVYPGKRLSLQMHHHRAEHWVIVSGTAMVTRDDETVLMKEDESIYLPLGCRHRLENPGKTPLTLIEVQTGSYLGEDDIVRFDDDFGRTPQKT